MSSTWRATPSSTFSRISQPATGRFSCTTTAIACVRSAIGNWPTPRARSPRASPRREFAPTTKSSSGRRIALSGWPRSGAACWRASCWCRWIIEHRPTSSYAFPGSSKRKPSWSAPKCRHQRRVTGDVWQLRDVPIRTKEQALGAGTRHWIEHPGTPEPRNPGTRNVIDPRRNHLHLRRDGRTERRDDHASERPREHHSD